MSKTARALVALAFLGGALAFYLGHRANHAAPVRVGNAAPDFRLTSLSNVALTLANYHGQVVVLNFWATWCPPCVEETPSLEKFAVETGPMGVNVIGVSVDEDAAALNKFIASYHLTYPIIRDPEQKLSSRFGTFKFPETYIIDRNGRVAEKIIGAIDWQDPRIISFVENLAPRGPHPQG